MQIEVFRKKDRYRSARNLFTAALLIVLGGILAYRLGIER